ncbi:NAC domain-containing protein JA2L-like [Oryza brachyantha]|uniref:NAC domain-containing protein n=1 Tax=Oryza brachyantha TaxID=4533 RepID=J3N1X2_ORYBR|nr:NAC domain-containing protein JA2L-like [Oryza brachyantha]
MAMMPQLTLTLPLGFKFQPTDQQLVVDYLQRRVVGESCIIPTVVGLDMEGFDPWHIPGMPLYGDKKWYFFIKTDHVDRTCVRMAPSGSWKTTGTNKTIFVTGAQGVPTAVKRAFVFYLGQPSLETNKTSWIMHEYCLTNPSTEEIVLCKISNKNQHELRAGLYDVAYNLIIHFEPLAMEHPNHVSGIDATAATDDLGDLDEENVSNNTTTTNNF